MAAEWSAGFGESDITPQPGARIRGYYFERLMKGIHDHLWARALAVSDGQDTFVFVSCDICDLDDEVVVAVRRGLEAEIAPDRLLLAATHAHTGPAK